MGEGYMVKAKAVEEVKYNEHLGDLDEFYNKNVRLIHKISNRYQNIIKRDNVDYEDIFQIATLGFIKAYERFDPVAFDVKFSTYCVPMMVGEIHRYLRDHGNRGGMKVSRKLRDLCNKIAMDDSYREDVETLAERYDTKVYMIKSALEFFTSHVQSMEEEMFSANTGEPVTLADQLGAEEDFSEIIAKEFLDYLTEREKQVVLLTMRGDLSQSQVGKIIGTSQAHVSRILKNKVGPLMKDYLEGKDLSTLYPKRKKMKADDEKMDKKVKRKPGRQPKPKEDYSYLDKKDLAKKSTRDLLLEGFEVNEIVFIKDIRKQSVYSVKSKLNKEIKEEEKPVVKYDSFDDLPVAKNIEELTKPDAVYQVKIAPVKIAPVKETAKSEKKLEFNLHTSSDSATKKEVMEDIVKIMETITAIGADSMSYNISIHSPAKSNEE